MAMQCPWCQRWALKDDACNWVCCGLESGSNAFVVGAGCGRQWCFSCGKRLCGVLYDSTSGQIHQGVSTSHGRRCCSAECKQAGLDPYESSYCQGGHNSHR
jgi:hypothetical protein